MLAAGDFAGAAKLVALLLHPLKPAQQREVLQDFCLSRARRGDTGALSCMVYLLADGLSLDAAKAFGESALATGTQADEVLIAQADILHRRDRRSGSVELMEKYLTGGRSTAYVGKLADFLRDRGLAFATEALLRRSIAAGRADLVPRLAEHYVEFRDWRSACELLDAAPDLDRSPILLWLLGRAAISLLLAEKLASIVARLKANHNADPRFAALLEDLWRWRVAEDKRPPRAMALDGLPPLLAQDAMRLIAGGQQPDAAMPMPMPVAIAGVVSVLGIGMQRTATTWLWHQMTLRPEVHRLGFKEPAYFADVFGALESVPPALREAALGDTALEYWNGPTRNLHDYRRLFDQAAPCRCDVSPAYGELPEATVQLVAQLLGPRTKILFSVRDPVERAWSNLKFDCNLAGIDPASLSAKQRRAHFTMPASRRRGDYATVLQTWQRHFADIHIVFHDDVARDPQAAMDGVWRWLGYETLPILAPPLNASSGEAMPAEDRDFLFSLYQPVYAQCEASLRGPALQWRQRQHRLLQENR